MNHKISLAVASGLVAFFSLVPALRAQESPLGHLSLLAGIRALDDPDHEQWPSVGVRLALGRREWRVRPELGLETAFNPVFGGSFTEASLGVTATKRRVSRAQPYWGLGYSRMQVDLGAASGAADAGYLDLGIVWSSDSGRGPGLDLRLLKGPGRRREDGLRDPVGYAQLSFVYRW
jgi:hypothetical protein